MFETIVNENGSTTIIYKVVDESVKVDVASQQIIEDNRVTPEEEAPAAPTEQAEANVEVAAAEAQAIIN